MSALTGLFHAAAFLHFVAWFGYDFFFFNFPNVLFTTNEAQRLGKLKFLTYWNLLVQTAYFTICVINDLTGTNEKYPKKTPLIRSIKDYLQASIAFPLSLFVCLTFWSIYAVDRELVFPKALDAFFPWWLNHVMHSNILVFTLLETALCFRKYPTRSSCILGLSVFMIVYLIWVHVIYYLSGEWVYPILNVLNLGQRIVFFLVMLCFTLALYILGELINNKIWERELAEGQKAKKGKKKSN